MPLFTKPQFNNVWASTGAKLVPEVAKISQGWVVEIPPHEFDNWMQNRQDALLAHLNQLGIPQWDSTVEYQAGKSYVQGTTTGVVYKSLTTHSNVNPETDIQNNWTVAFQSSGSALLKLNNLSDVPDKAQARVNLGIATTEFYDGRYLLKTTNLSDVPNKASARSNLGLGEAATKNVGVTANTVAAGDDSRIVNAVNKSTKVVAGAGLAGGGELGGDVTLRLATPSTITRVSGNTVSGDTHTHAIDLTALTPPYVWQNMEGSRSNGGTYINDKPYLIFVSVISIDTKYWNGITAYVAGVLVFDSYVDPASKAHVTATFPVPPGASYTVRASAGIAAWKEMR